MNKFAIFVSLLGLFGTDAFAPVALRPQKLTHMSDSRCQIRLRMSDEETSEAEATPPPAPTSGTFYDDEVDPIPAQKQGISDSMKERLMREASTGLDADQKQTNVLLYIMGVVAVLVILGGQGILY